MRRTTMLGVAGIAFFAASARAQQVVNVWPGVAPGSERWTQTERTFENTPVGTVVMNVVTPTITAYLPEPAKATGTGVVIAPGGAFVALAISLEATDLARWLQERGVAAFVLKYRTVEKKQDGIPRMDMDTAGRYGIADGIQALTVVRRHAAAWGVSPDRVGIVGFSAGGITTMNVATAYDASSRPDFIGVIYGAAPARPVPKDAPPAFIALAADDGLMGHAGVPIFEDWRAAGKPVELHVYAAGDHGFGMRNTGTSADNWLEHFTQWMRASKLLPQ